MLIIYHCGSIPQHPIWFIGISFEKPILGRGDLLVKPV